MLHILVVDDHDSLAEAMKAKVESALSSSAQVTAFTGENLKNAIHKLRQREREWKRDSDWRPRQYDTPLDLADILVLDYRLADLYGQHGYMTGEDLAALARRYSRAGPIVSVNRLGEQSFDLRLRAETETWAEMSVAHDDLRNRRLWSAEAEGLYRPWGWSSLEHLPELFDQRVEHALTHLNRPVAKSLGISKTQMDLMPRRVSESLGEEPFSITFEQVAIQRAFQSRGVPRPSQQHIARVAAAEVGKWLSHWVLPGQDILIDAPHLVARYPSLMEDGRTQRTQTSLNKLAQIANEGSLPLRATRIEDARFRPTFWLDRPAWWTELVLDNRRLDENSRPWEMEPLGYCFAEDTSMFHDPSECQPFQAVGTLSERYVRIPDARIHYKPVSRLLG